MPSSLLSAKGLFLLSFTCVEQSLKAKPPKQN